MIKGGIDLAALELSAFVDALTRWHPELARPVRYADFAKMAQREGVTVQILPLSHPARLLRLGQHVSIQINRDQPARHWAVFGMHELAHYWRDDVGECCYHAEATWLASPSEDFAETFAWHVTTVPRVAPPWVPPGTLLSAGFSFPVRIVGTSYRRQALEQICGAGRWHGSDLMVTAVLVLDDTNPHDSNAVRIEIEGQPVGFLAREDARRYRAMLIRQGLPRRSHHCWARVTGGWERGGGDRGHHSVRLDLRLG